MTQVHPGINIKLQHIRNTSEYISKLQFHQHSLLTRKVFSRHNFSTLVFFSVSTRSSLHIHLQVIFISRSSSSSDLDHHHWIWIITGSGSSFDLDHHWTSSLEHHLWIWIISVGASSQVLYHDSSHHRKFHRASPFSCWL